MIFLIVGILLSAVGLVIIMYQMNFTLAVLLIVAGTVLEFIGFKHLRGNRRKTGYD